MPGMNVVVSGLGNLTYRKVTSIASETGATTLTTSTFDAYSGTLLVAMVCGLAVANPVQTMSGGGLTWNLIGKDYGSTFTYAYYAWVPSSATITVTSTLGITSGNSRGYALAVYEFTGAHLYAPIEATLFTGGGSRSGAYSAALNSTVSTTSIVISCSVTDEGTNTPATGWTSDASYSIDNGGWYVETEFESKDPPTDSNVYYDAITTIYTWSVGAIAIRKADTSSVGTDRAVFAGGDNYAGTVYYCSIDYVTISSTGNGADFGDLTDDIGSFAGCASDTRGVFWGGWANAGSYSRFEIDYITIATTGNASDFGDMLYTNTVMAGLANQTRGLFAGGIANAWPNASNVMEYVTIASTGNATDFGDLATARMWTSGLSSYTRGVICGGGTGAWSGTASNIIDYITIASTGNSTDFGDLNGVKKGIGTASSQTRGIVAGGHTGSASVNVIDYITIDTTSNATDFGDLTITMSYLAGTSSRTRALFGGGAAPTNVISYITIASVGNATDFGDMITSKSALAATSDCHGGL